MGAKQHILNTFVILLIKNMKRSIALLLTVFCFAKAEAQLFKITLHAVNYKSGVAYLAYYMGKDLDAEDSAAINVNGVAVFTGKRRLPGGIYSIVFPGKNKALDFLIDTEQVLTIRADTSDLTNKVTLTGSKANPLFFRYQKFIAEKGKQLNSERNAYMQATTSTDSLFHENNYNTLFEQLDKYRDSIMQHQPSSMMAVLLKAMKEPVPALKKPVTHADSIVNFNYYKAHYWDGITFMDERVIRTPFFLPKLERYYREVIDQNADSIIQISDYQMLLARSCPEMYKFLLNWLTDEYINPKYMGEDAVFVHLYNYYHSKGLSPWLTQKQDSIISRRAMMLMSNLIGDQAADLNMLDTAGKATTLYDVNADYTLVCFWDPSCGHCQKLVPQIDSIYNASWKQHGLKVFAVLTEDHVPEWKTYIHKHHLDDWVNVYETKEMEDANYAAQRPDFKQLYDVTITPTLFLLDKEKHIIAKKLTWDQIDDFLHLKWNSKTAAN
jgi:peroxiredoxin